ncbi:MAG TPA: RHS repeat-associated core domain-containing protein [Flavipsychrobacter sp.]|nr:RHS repeat-associated core domain-containing protein [Flavipsychrobacter sp.]
MRVKNIYNSQTAKLTEVWQQMDNEPWQPIRKYQYDAFGRVVHKWIGGAEEQDFTYDINGRAIGVNEAYINSANAAFTPTRTFAEKLSFEQGFTDRRFDGALSGFRWRTAGGSVNAYGYSYDDMGRMTAADFRENITPNSSPTWSKAAKDFSVANISYDANGNMLTMKQYGYNNSLQPDLIDDLTYQYTTNTNQLASVTDSGVASPIQDFNNNAGNTAFYQYDANGNLSADNLKGIALGYNFRDQPLRVLKGVDEIQNIYDAGGTLLHKNITEAGLPVTYSYWGPFVYRNDTLLYVLHPEGRCRWVNDTGVFRYDYFINDHIGNVRTTVTTDAASLSTYYLATHEVASAHLEEQIFDNINEVRDVRPGGTPGDVDAAELDGGDPDRRIGTSLLVHVMAGDNISLQGYSYHEGKDEGEEEIVTPEDMMSALITTLTGGVGGFDGGEEGNGMDLLNAMFPVGGNNYNIYESLKQANTDPSKPRAYLNYLFFDEGLNLIKEGSGVIQVSGTANSWEQISLPGLPVNASGYFLTYVSNEQGQPVWFDNLAITYTKGRLLEEHNYYPHGLLSEGAITAGVDPKNQYKHQSKLLQEELGMQLYDFHARQYDPQIGRFWSVDPLDEFASGYIGMGNNPANLIDPSGMQTRVGQSAGQLGGGANWEDYSYLDGVGSPGRDVFHYMDRASGNGGSGRGSGYFETGYTVAEALAMGANHAATGHYYLWAQDGDDLSTLHKDYLMMAKEGGGRRVSNNHGPSYGGYASHGSGSGGESGEGNGGAGGSAGGGDQSSIAQLSPRTGELLSNADKLLKPIGIPLSAIEFQLGKALSRSDYLDRIKPGNKNVMLDVYPSLKTRPVNIHLPGGVRIEIPRNVVTGIGKGLQTFGVFSAIIGGASDFNKFNNGEISGTHLTVNFIMSGVGFLGPWGAGASIVYGLAEDSIWGTSKK